LKNSLKCVLFDGVMKTVTRHRRVGGMRGALALLAVLCQIVVGSLSVQARAAADQSLQFQSAATWCDGSQQDDSSHKHNHHLNPDCAAMMLAEQADHAVVLPSLPSVFDLVRTVSGALGGFTPVPRGPPAFVFDAARPRAPPFLI